MKLFRTLVLIGITLFGQATAAAPIGDCVGTPADAAVDLPFPLDKWAQIVCTPYGHIISNKNSWIWSYPGGYAPVFIPSQMVQNDPKELGNNSYFAKIDMTSVGGDEFLNAYSVFHAGLDPTEAKPSGYRLDVTSNSGESLKFYFFDYGDSAWGIWCRETCDPKLRFMMLDMSKRPSKARQEVPSQLNRP